ncbi:MAG: hypothetical protein K9I34_04575, partial [Bacteroidales bacterium]|nr:hypothetical protein [Bacteroidales bacterium]
MKALPILLGFWLLMLTQSLQSQTIYSTTSGGDWNDTLTWVGHEVPIWSNHVVINGPVTIQTGFWSHCMNLTVSSNCSLTGGSVYAEELKVYGGITNYGTIESGSGVELRILTRGYLMNYGSLDIKRLLFDAGNDKNFFSTSMLMIDEIAKNDTSDIILTSDIQLDSCWMNFGSPGHGIFLNGYSLNLLKGIFTCRLWGNAGNFILTDDTKILNAYISGEVHLLGQVNLTGTNYFYGDIYNEGTLYNSGSYPWDNNFYGNLYNSGSILEDPTLSLILNLYQDFYNEGTVDIYKLSFMGSHNHSIESSNPLIVDNLNVGTSDTLTFMGDIELINSYISTSSYALINIDANTLKLNASTLSAKVQVDGGTLWCNNNSGLSQSTFMDDIYLKGDVNISGGGVHFYGATEVLDTLQCTYYYGLEVSFHDQLLNSGTICNGTALTVYTYGDLINDGIISVNSLYFSGTDVQNLSTNQVLNPTNIYISNTLGISMNTELKLSNSTLNGYNHAIYLHDFGALLDNVNLSSAHVYSDTTYLHAINDGYISSCKFYGPIELKGIININGSDTYFYDETTLSDTLQRVYNYYSTSVNFAGNLINNGLITNNGLSINCMADLSNHGVINCYGVTMAGSGAQTLVTSQAIQCDWFSSSDTTGYISAGSDLYFDHAPISLNGEQLLLNGYQLNLTGDYITNSSVYNGQLKFSDGAYTSSSKFYGNIDLQGLFLVYGGSNYFYGPTVVADTLSCVYNYYGNSVDFYSLLTNNGLITNSGLSVNLYDELINNAVFENGYLYLKASDDQTIWTNAPIAPVYLMVSSADTLGTIIAGGDLYIQNSYINLNGEDLNLAGHELKLNACHLNNSKVIGNDGALNFSNVSDIASVKFYTPINIKGKVFIANGSNQFWGPVTVIDTLTSAYNYYGLTAYFYNDLFNEGHVGSPYLSIETSGNIINNGYWSLSKISLTGTQNQTIELVNEHYMNTLIRMYAEVPSATTFDWSKNGFSLIGETANLFYNESGEYLTLSQQIIDTSYVGLYQCTTNAGNSRQIVIEAYEQLLSVDLGPDASICEGDEYLLEPAILNGTPPYAFLWSTGATTSFLWASPSSSMTYAVTITDALGASANDDMQLTINLLPLVMIDGISAACEGQSVELLVSAFGDYQWSTGAQTQMILVENSGTLSVTVTDVNGCSASDEHTILFNVNPIVDLGPDVIACDGDFIILEPYMSGDYLWSTGSTMNHLAVQSSGNYAVTLTDMHGCSDVDDVNVTLMPVPVVSLGADQQLTQGNITTLDAGAGFESYYWSNGDTTQTIVVDTTGIYWVEVANAAGCYGFDEVNITFECGSLGLGGGAFPQNCGYQELGHIDVFSDFGMPPFTYNWSNGGEDYFIFDSAGTYNVTVTDALGCSDMMTFTIPLSTVLELELGPNQTVTQGSVVELSAPLNMQLYYWSTNETTQSILVDTSGTYYIDIMDTLGCYASDQITINFNPVSNPLEISLPADASICEGDEYLLEPAILNGTPPYAFLWSTGETTSFLWASPSSSMTYAVTV